MNIIIPDLVKRMWKETLIVLITVILCLVTLQTCNQKNKLNSQQALVSSINSELTKTKNKLGEETAKSELIVSDNTKLFLSINSKDSTIIKLQGIVEANKKTISKYGSATIFGTNTTINSTNVTDSIILRDTIREGNTVTIYPQYQFKVNQFNDWITGSGYANKDSSHLDIKIKNEAEIVIGYSKDSGIKNLFKKAKPYAIVKNKNPYTETSEFKTYAVALPKPKRFGIGLSLSGGFNFGGYSGTSLRIQPGIQLGIGINYNLIEF